MGALAGGFRARNRNDRSNLYMGMDENTIAAQFWPQASDQVLTTLIKKATVLDQTVTLEYALPLPKNGTETPILAEKLGLRKKVVVL